MYEGLEPLVEHNSCEKFCCKEEQILGKEVTARKKGNKVAGRSDPGLLENSQARDKKEKGRGSYGKQNINIPA